VATIRAEIVVPGEVEEVEAFWYDVSRWPTWVDGLAHIDRVSEEWPHEGGKVVWDSTPAGRGRVVERVAEQRPGDGQRLEVEDEQIRGDQSVLFSVVDGGVLVELALTYAIKKRSIVTPVVDVLFIRRAFAGTLDHTLRRFAVELAADRELHSGTS
jgi:hypothetical protein